MQRILRDEGHALVDSGLPARRQALIHRHCPPSIGHLFATPREGRDGCLEWWSELHGQPQRREALSSAEQFQLDERLTQRLAALGNLIDELERRDSPAAAELRGLPSQPAEDTIYSVGGDPVLIRWAPVKTLPAPTEPPVEARETKTSPPPAAPPRASRRWVTPVTLPLLLGGLALLGLGLWLALQHFDRFSLPWSQAEPLSVQDRVEPVLGTGDVQVTLRWDSADDLDLAVTDPRGDTAFYNNPSIASGGQLDIDSNAGCTSSVQNPVENIFWDSSNTPNGRYVASVTLYQSCGDNQDPIPFELSITLDGHTEILTGEVSNHSSRQSFEFNFP